MFWKQSRHMQLKSEEKCNVVMIETVHTRIQDVSLKFLSQNNGNASVTFY